MPRQIGLLFLGLTLGTFLSVGDAIADSPPAPSTNSPTSVSTNGAGANTSDDSSSSAADRESVQKLEERVKKLEEENAELEKRTETTFPTMSEKNSSDFEVFVTFVVAAFTFLVSVFAALLTLAGLIWAIKNFNEIKEKLLHLAFARSSEATKRVHDFIKARARVSFGSSCGLSAWNSTGTPTPTDLTHLQRDAYDFSEQGYLEFKSLMQNLEDQAQKDPKKVDEGKWLRDEYGDLMLSALNNVVYYGSLIPLLAEGSKIVNYAEQLKAAIGPNGTRYLSTYVLARIKFRAFFRTHGHTKTLHDVDRETWNEFKRIEQFLQGRNIDDPEVLELEWLRTLLEDLH